MTTQVRIQHQTDTFSLDLSFTIKDQSITALYGKSGSGKTTILRYLAGLIRGNARIQWQEELWQETNGPFVPAHKRPVGLVFQDSRLLPHLNVSKNLAFALRRAKGKALLSYAEVLENLGLTPLLQQMPHQLSAGQKQRVAIARTILNAPRLLLMDEPLSNLDQRSKTLILKFIDNLHQKTDLSIVYVSHDINEVCHLADQLILIDEGRLIEQGSLLNLSTRLDLMLAHEEDAAAIVEGEIVDYDPHYQITTIKLDDEHQLQLSQKIARSTDDATKQLIRLRIPARDISLAKEAPISSSILNILPVTIDAIEVTEAAQVLIRLQLAEQSLLARISKKSVDRLQLAPGQKIFAQIKSIALVSERN